jgi:hypothetical protein
VKTKEKTKKPYPNRSKSIRKKKKKKTQARPTAERDLGRGSRWPARSRPAVGPLRLHCGSADPRLLPSLPFFFFSSLPSLLSLFFLLLDENQLWEGLYFFCAIFLLYVRCHALSECYKTHLLQMDRIVGFPFVFWQEKC